MDRWEGRERMLGKKQKRKEMSPQSGDGAPKTNVTIVLIGLGPILHL